MHKKDNLTDLIERLPKEALTDISESYNQQVVNIDGDIVTLGHKKVADIAISTFKRKLNELADRHTPHTSKKK